MSNDLNLHEALSVVQQTLKAPKNQRNSFGNYNYRSCEDILEAVKPLLSQVGISMYIADEAVSIEGWHYIKSTVTCTKGDKAQIVTAYAREEQTKKGMDASQISGSASSYARKYALNGMFLIDDTKDADAQNNGSESTTEPQKAKSKPVAMSPKERFWKACQATVKKEGSKNIKADAEKLAKSMVQELGGNQTDDDYNEMALVLEQWL